MKKELKIVDWCLCAIDTKVLSTGKGVHSAL